MFWIGLGEDEREEIAVIELAGVMVNRFEKLDFMGLFSLVRERKT